MDTNVCRLSVDIEAAGSNPHDRALLEIGICSLEDLSQGFEMIFKPDPIEFDRHAMHAIRRPIQEFREKGVLLVDGINDMLQWIDTVAKGRKVQFKGLNIAYDWMFLKYAVAKVKAENNLPYKVEEIASYGMGVFRSSCESYGDTWLITQLRMNAPELIEKYHLHKDKGRQHLALDDARYQGRLLLALEEYAKNH